MKAIRSEPITQSPDAQRAGRPGFIQNRMQNFGLTMVVMGVSFILYYLGFFGTVSGPLQPQRIGDRLAALGFSSHHLLSVLLSLTIIAISWNWIYNGIIRLLGRHMRCAFHHQGEGLACSAPVSDKLSDSNAGRYVCTAGHSCPRVFVRSIKKGTVGHFMWMMWLVFSVIVFYLS